MAERRFYPASERESPVRVYWAPTYFTTFISINSQMLRNNTTTLFNVCCELLVDGPLKLGSQLIAAFKPTVSSPIFCCPIYLILKVHPEGTFKLLSLFIFQ